MTMTNQRMRAATEPLEEPDRGAWNARVARTDLTVPKTKGLCDVVELDKQMPRGEITELVNHPDHYNQGKIEVIDFINDQVDGGLCWNLATAIKHLARSPHKGQQVTDLQKAIWYTQHKLVRITSPEEVATWLESVAEGIRKKTQK